jgi:hypothetical protein
MNMPLPHVRLLLAICLACNAAGCVDSGPATVAEPSSSEAAGQPVAKPPNKDPASNTESGAAKPAEIQAATRGTPLPDRPIPDDRSLPPATGAQVDSEPPTEETEETEETGEGWDPDGPLPEEIAAAAFRPPPGATPLSKTGRLWIDPARSRVYVDGYVALKRGPLEMFACPVGTKEHESIVAALAKSREVHAALLAVKASPGTPVRFLPDFLPPTGQVIRVWVCWYDSKDQFHAVDAREWIEDLETEKAMAAEWVFAGSGFWQDPEDKREYYQADAGDMICVSNFASAMLDVAISSSAEAGSLRFIPMESKIPDRQTPVRLVLVPVPFPTDTPDPQLESERLQRPTDEDVPRAARPIQ